MLKLLKICIQFPGEGIVMSGNQDLLRLAELLCARLCHDLSGPLGALIGILDLAREEAPDSETVSLAEETATELAQRLKLLRAAWGRESDDLDKGRLEDFAAGLLSGRRVRFDLGGLAPERLFSPAAARVMLNLLLLAAESLPGGGMVALADAPSDGVLMTISGARAAWPAGFSRWLAEPDTAVDAMLADPRRLQAPLTALLVHGYGYRLSMLMPASAVGPSELSPPLLLSLRP
jgi:histidine phosphotransferase ChpT